MSLLLDRGVDFYTSIIALDLHGFNDASHI